MERRIPSSTEAERSLLGCMLSSADAVIAAQETLTENDFFDPVNREIYSAMLYIAFNNRPVDLVTLNEELSRRGKLELVGGFDYIIELMQGVPSAANAASYVRIVDEKSTLRKLISAAQQIEQSSYTAEEETADILSEAEKLIYDITMRRGGEQLQSIQPVLLRTFELIERLVKNKGRIEGVPTGYKDLDKMTTGLHSGELILIAARPSMGKTALGMNIIGNAAIRGKKRAAVFTLEMPSEQIVLRMLCTESGVDMTHVRSGLVSDKEWFDLSDAMSRIGESSIYIDATPGITVPDIRSKARRMQIENGLDVIMIDYLQLMSGHGKFGSRQEEVAIISRSLKALAVELGIPIIALSQLSRAPTGRTDKRPMLNDIRDSGAIEQDADVVMFLHREDYYNHDSEMKGFAEIIIAKQRNGELGTCVLSWDGPHTKFSDLPPGTKLPEK